MYFIHSYPPESIEEPTNAGRFSCAGDVWGYGILMWEIFSDGASARYVLHLLDFEHVELYRDMISLF